MSKKTTFRRAAGLTLVEVAIASMIMGGLVLAVFAILASGTSESQSMTASLKSDSATRDFFQKFSEDFRAAGSTVTVTDPLIPYHRLYKANAYNKAAFSIQTGFTASKTAFSLEYKNRVEYTWELSEDEDRPPGQSVSIGIDGKDSDKNGLVDDGMVRRKVVDVTNPLKEVVVENAVILRNVTNRGFYVEYVPDSVSLNDMTINLEVFFIDPNKTMKDPESYMTLQGHTTRMSSQRVSRRRA